MSGHVVVVGSANVDTVVRVERHPSPGETVLGLDVRRVPGGKGANQAMAVARSGAAVAFVGRVGADEDGRGYRDLLERHGVDVTALGESPDASTGAAHIRVDAGGENSIVVISGANAELGPEEVRASAGLIEGAAVVLLVLESPAPAVAEAMRIASEAGVLTMLNASPVTDQAADLARRADVVVVNEHEAALLPDLPDVCVTLGADGAVWGQARSEPPPVSVVDTTGAGDVFVGTLAGSVAGGLSRADALAAAVAAAATSTTWSGAQPPED